MKYLIIIALIFIIFANTGCYYDKPFLDSGNAACDTANVTYSGSINPILSANCTGCHSGADAPLGIKLDAYTTVKIQATNGKLLGTITHSAGFSPMPKNGNKLSDCNIAKIRKWIAEGAQDN